jgi:hypothetical protein
MRRNHDPYPEVDVMAALTARGLSLLGLALLGVGCSSSDSAPVARGELAAQASARARLALASATGGSSDRASAPAPAGTSTAIAASVSAAGEPIVGGSSPGGSSRSAARASSAAASRAEVVVARLAPLRVKRLVLARSIASREPVDVASRFSAAEIDRIYAFVEIENPDRAESEIVVTFEPEQGAATGHVRLDVGASSRWRTWAFTRAARQPGAWAAVVRDGQGTVLARTAFEVAGEAALPAAAATPAPAPALQAPPVAGATGGAPAAATL